MKKKRLISVMLAGVMGLGMSAMSGCDYNTELYGEGENGKSLYIIIESKDEKKVHKGSYEPIIYDPAGYGYAGSGLIKLKLDCGKNWTTNADCYITESEPDKEDYDKFCKGCFV